MNLEDILHTYRVMRSATKIGNNLRCSAVTQYNIKQFPRLERIFEEIYDEGETLRSYSTINQLIGVTMAFIREPIKFILAQMYVRKNVAPYCRRSLD